MLRAFLLLHLEGRNLVLAVSVFAACAAMGFIGAGISRVMRTPAPETRFLFQGFEAGMLGYALFGGYHGAEQLPSFAALDIGQVIYVFTVLMVQMNMAAHAQVGQPFNRQRAVFPWRDIVNSKVLWAIGLGVVLSLAAPDVAQTLGDKSAVMNALFITVGGLTTPLVCLVIGASLSGGLVLSREVVAVVAARLVVAAAIGLGVAYWVVPGLGFGQWQQRAALMLFVLPPPFVVPVYYKGNSQFVSSVLTLFTLVAIVVIAILVLVGVA